MMMAAKMSKHVESVLCDSIYFFIEFLCSVAGINFVKERYSDLIFSDFERSLTQSAVRDFGKYYVRKGCDNMCLYSRCSHKEIQVHGHILQLKTRDNF